MKKKGEEKENHGMQTQPYKSPLWTMTSNRSQNKITKGGTMESQVDKKNESN